MSKLFQCSPSICLRTFGLSFYIVFCLGMWCITDHVLTRPIVPNLRCAQIHKVQAVKLRIFVKLCDINFNFSQQRDGIM